MCDNCSAHLALTLDGQSGAVARFWRECDTVVEFIVGVMIAMQIQHWLWTDSSVRERDSGANRCSPEANCRPTLGSQKCDTVIEFSVCVMIPVQI